MKKLIGLIVLVGLILTGCSQLENNITEPEIYSLPKTNESVNITPDGSLTETIFASKEIDGALGGQVTILQDVVDSKGRIINIYAELIVPVGAYQGIKTISMNVDWKTASVDFNPSMQFDTSVTLSCIFANLPLAQMGYKRGDKVQFMYIDSCGNTYPILSKDVSVNYYMGRLRVNKAKIEHFSRYGFIRKDERAVQNQYHYDQSSY